MTSANSEAPSKPPDRARRRLLSLAGLVFILLLAAGLGPPLLLNLLLNRLEPDGRVSCQEARAGFLFRSLTLTGLEISRPGPGGYELALQRLHLDGLSPLSLFRLIRADRDRAAPARPLFLAEELVIEGLEGRQAGARLTLASGRLHNLTLEPETWPAPVWFERLEARDFHAAWAAQEQPWGFQLHSLEVGGPQLEALRSGLTGPAEAVWGWLAGCDRLALEGGLLTRSGRPALTIESILFDQFDQGGGGRAGTYSFRRRFQAAADLPALSGDSPEPFWSESRAILGDGFQAGLELELAYQPAAARADRARASLALPGLGRLELTGALGGLAPVKPGRNLSQLLLSANGWQLEDLSLVYDDEGLAGRLARRLEETGWPGEPPDSAPDRLLALVQPALADFPVLAPEVEAFIRQPGRLQIASKPEKPLPLIALVNSLAFMSLANQNQYDIIKQLHLTLTANDRPPILVTAAE